MRRSFYEYYNMSDAELKEIWQTGVIVFDTNVLLDLYRKSEATKEEILNVIKHFQDRIWLPYQIGLEFHRDRIKVISDQVKQVNEIENDICTSIEKLKKDIINKYNRNSYVDIKYINHCIERIQKSLNNNIKKSLDKCPKNFNDDLILNKLSEFFDGKVGEDFSEEQLKSLYSEGSERYQKKTPPGYKDNNKKNEGERIYFGDFILWKQIIDKAQKDKHHIIFVTNDEKEDWWNIVNGKKIGPRIELVKEFRENTNKLIGFYTLNRFIEYAQRISDIRIKAGTIKELNKPEKKQEEIESSTFSELNTILFEQSIINMEEGKNIQPSLQSSEDTFTTTSPIECTGKLITEGKSGSKEESHNKDINKHNTANKHNIKSNK